jgi:hypothetical protein
MMTAFDAALRRASPFVSIALLLIFGVGTLAFEARRERLGGAALLDSTFSYSPEHVTALLRRLGAEGRYLYAWSELTLDVLFPFTYGLLFSLLIAQLFPQWGRLILLLPLTAALFDILENISIAYMAFTFSGEPPTWAGAAQLFTRAKMVLVISSLAALMLGVVCGLRRPA